MIKTKFSDEKILYCVVVQDPLTKKPIEYAFFETEPEAVAVMCKIISRGQFAAVAKKRINNKK